MPKKTKTEEIKPIKPTVIHVPLEMPTMYVNHAQLAFSAFDASIIVGELVSGDAVTQTMKVHPRAKIVMTHRFLIEFANLINRNLEQFSQDEELQAEANIQIENIAEKD